MRHRWLSREASELAYRDAIHGDPDGVLEGPIRVRLTPSVDFDDRIVACADYSQATRDGEPRPSRRYYFYPAEAIDHDQTRQQKIVKFTSLRVTKDSSRADDRRCADWADDS